MKTKILFLALTLVAIILAGCGNQGQNWEASSGSAGYDPCQLLRADDVAEIFPGANITNTQHDTKANAIGQKICFYSADEDDMKFAQLSFIDQRDMPEGLDVVTLFDQAQTLTEQAQVVDGVGDKAFYGGSGLKAGSGLHVLKQDISIYYVVTVGLGFGNSDQTVHLAAEKSLAETVLARSYLD